MLISVFYYYYYYFIQSVKCLNKLCICIFGRWKFLKLRLMIAENINLLSFRCSLCSLRGDAGLAQQSTVPVMNPSQKLCHQIEFVSICWPQPLEERRKHHLNILYLRKYETYIYHFIHFHRFISNINNIFVNLFYLNST